MFNLGKYNELKFNQLPSGSVPEPESIVGNTLVLQYDTDVVPITYIGEQHSFSNSPWTPHDGMDPYQWVLTRDLRLLYASADGNVYQYGIGTTDNTQKIHDYYETKYIDLSMPDRVKRLRWIDIDAEAEPGTILIVSYKIDNDIEWRPFCELEQGNYKYTFVDIDAPMFRKIKLRFESGYTGCKYVINSFSLDMVVHGQHKEVI